MSDWKAAIETAKARKARALAALSDADQEEIDGRAEALIEEEEASKLERRRIGLDLDRRVDAARERLGVKVRLRGIVNAENTFVLRDPGKAAFNAWTEANSEHMAATVQGKPPKMTSGEVARILALPAVVDWRPGPEAEVISDFGATSTAGDTLAKYLAENPGVVNAIWAVAFDLARATSEERKRGT